MVELPVSLRVGAVTDELGVVELDGRPGGPEFSPENRRRLAAFLRQVADEFERVDGADPR